jgi:ketosteroid isomerase-like protein
MRRRLSGALLILSMIVSACGSADKDSARDIFEDFENTLNSGDLDATLTLLTEDVAYETFDMEHIFGIDEVESRLKLVIDSGEQVEFSNVVETVGLKVIYDAKCTISGELITGHGGILVLDGLITGLIFC